MGFIKNDVSKEHEKLSQFGSEILGLFNLQPGILFWGGERASMAATREAAFGRGRKKERLIQLLHESSVASPESGLLSDWLKNKKIL